MKLARFVCTVAAGVALGALLLGRGIIIPAFDDNHLVDANLAKALVGPMHLRLMEVVAVCSGLLAMLAHRWIGAKWATTLALLATASAFAQRFVVLPKLYATWARSDLTAGRPVDRMLLAEQLQTQDALMTLTTVVLLLALLAASMAEAETKSACTTLWTALRDRGNTARTPPATPSNPPPPSKTMEDAPRAA